MDCRKTAVLKNGEACCIRSATAQDAAAVLEHYILTHGETDYLLACPDECNISVEQEADFLDKRNGNPEEIFLVAALSGKIAGSAGVSALGVNCKVRHRAELGIAVEKSYWGLGIGTLLTDACIEFARGAGYSQLELEVVSENAGAIAMYEKAGFVEYGRNPGGFYSRMGGLQELVYMRLEL